MIYIIFDFLFKNAIFFFVGLFGLYRLTVRTNPSQGLNRGSIPRRVTNGAKPNKLLYLRAVCEGAGLVHEHANSRAGVANTYIFYERSEVKYLVIRDHINSPFCFTKKTASHILG